MPCNPPLSGCLQGIKLRVPSAFQAISNISTAYLISEICKYVHNLHRYLSVSLVDSGWSTVADVCKTFCKTQKKQCDASTRAAKYCILVGFGLGDCLIHGIR